MTSSGTQPELKGRLFGVPDRSRLSVRIALDSRGFHLSLDQESWLLPYDPAQMTLGGADGDMIVVRDPEPNLALYVPLDGILGSADLLPPTIASRVQSLAEERDRQRSRSYLFAVGGLLACGLLLWIGWMGMGAILEIGLDQIPVSWEEQLGESALASVAPEEDRVTNPQIVKPVKAILDRLLGSVDENPYEFDLHVVWSDEINAFATPGGKVVILTGMLDAAESPEEVAGVLAHEIQHVLKRHSLKKMAESLKWQLAMMILIGDAETLQEMLLVNAGKLFNLSYDRDYERESDTLGLKLLYRAGMDPQGMPRFFETLKKRDSGPLTVELAFLSTHPGHEERIDQLEKMIAELGEPEITPLDIDWGSLKEAVSSR